MKGYITVALAFALIGGIPAFYGIRDTIKETSKEKLRKPNRFEGQFHKADSVFTSKYLEGNYKIIIISCD